MGILRDRMVEEMKLRNFSPATPLVHGAVKGLWLGVKEPVNHLCTPEAKL